MPARFGMSLVDGAKERIIFARAEELQTSYSYQKTWTAGQRCIVPAKYFFAANFNGDQTTVFRVSRKDNRALGIPGIWESKQLESGQEIFGFLMVSVSARDDKILGGRKYEDYRIVALLERENFDIWLHGSTEEAHDLLEDFSSELLEMKSEPRNWKSVQKRRTKTTPQIQTL